MNIINAYILSSIIVTILTGLSLNKNYNALKKYASFNRFFIIYILIWFLLMFLNTIFFLLLNEVLK